MYVIEVNDGWFVVNSKKDTKILAEAKKFDTHDEAERYTKNNGIDRYMINKVIDYDEVPF